MAGRTAVLAIHVVADAARARRELDQTGDSVQSVGQKASKFKLPALAVVGGLAAIAKGAAASASVLQQSTGAVASVYGKYASGVIKQSKGAATAVGLSMSAYQNLSVVLGSQLKNMGVPLDQVAGSTSTLIKKGADLSAMFGGTASDAVEAISALLRGERDPIERYGVSITAAQIKAYEAAKGLTHLSGAQQKAADTQATLALLNKQTAQATGQFSRETKTAAGSQEIANAKMENARALMGQKLLPVVAKVQGAMAGLFGLIGSHVGVVTVLAGVMGVLATAVLAVSVYERVAAAVTKVWAAAQVIFNAIMAANPVVLLVLALAALVAGLVLAYQHSETFRAIVQAAFAVVVAAGQLVANFFVHTLPAAFNSTVAFLRKWAPLALAVLLPFIGIPLLIWQHFSAIKGYVSSAFSAAYTAAKSWIGSIVTYVAGVPGRLAASAIHWLNAGKDLIASLFKGLVNATKGAAGWVGDFVGSITHALAKGINNALGLPWRIKVHIPIPAAPDVNFGPYTVLPSIPFSAWVPPTPPRIDELLPGFTLLASALSPFAGNSFPVDVSPSRTRAGDTIVKVEFSGLVTDPDGTARAIKKLLDDRDRRLGRRA